jgi:hypothetical protein
MPTRRHGNVNLHMESTRIRDHVAWTINVETNEEMEERLQAQAIY